jgi:ferritin-like metal-binding protein YciE
MEDFEDEALDAGLISAAQRVEHYEIAAYGTVCAFADLLGEAEQASRLGETLEEEKAADQKLTQLSDEINVEANKPSSSESEPRGKRGSKRVA